MHALATTIKESVHFIFFNACACNSYKRKCTKIIYIFFFNTQLKSFLGSDDRREREREREREGGQTDRQKDRQRQRETERQTNRDRYRQTDRQTDRQTERQRLQRHGLYDIRRNGYSNVHTQFGQK